MKYEQPFHFFCLQSEHVHFTYLVVPWPFFFFNHFLLIHIYFFLFLSRFLRLQLLAILRQSWMVIIRSFSHLIQVVFDLPCLAVVSMSSSVNLITGNHCLCWTSMQKFFNHRDEYPRSWSTSVIYWFCQMQG